MRVDKPLSESISDQIKVLETVSERRGLRLRLPDALEKQFRAYYNAELKNYRRVSLLLPLIAVIVVCTLDMLFAGGYFSLAVEIPSIVISLIFAVILFTPWFEVKQQEIVTAACFYMMSVATGILLVSPNDVYAVYLVAYILLILFIGTVVRLMFVRALITNILLYVSLNCLLLWWRPQPIDLVVAYNAYYLCGLFMALTVGYFMERAARREFIHIRLLHLEQGQLKEMNSQLQHIATVDSLTGISNRRQLEINFETEWRRCRRSNAPLSMLMIDLDAFKQYNDVYGHQVGDECLQKVAQVIAATFMRLSDTVARYGGEEFAVLLPETSLDDAKELAETVCENVRKLKISHVQSETADIVTASVGISSCIPTGNEDYESLIRNADMALYQAKRQGRNQVVVYLSENQA